MKNEKKGHIIAMRHGYNPTVLRCWDIGVILTSLLVAAGITYIGLYWDPGSLLAPIMAGGLLSPIPFLICWIWFFWEGGPLPAWMRVPRATKQQILDRLMKRAERTRKRFSAKTQDDTSTATINAAALVLKVSELDLEAGSLPGYGDLYAKRLDELKAQQRSLKQDLQTIAQRRTAFEERYQAYAELCQAFTHLVQQYFATNLTEVQSKIAEDIATHHKALKRCWDELSTFDPGHVPTHW